MKLCTRNCRCIYLLLTYHFSVYAHIINFMCTVILQDEKMEHAKTKCALANEEEKLQFVSTELQVLRKQLEREKATFEKAYVFMCVYFTTAIQSCSSLLIVVYYCLFTCCICIVLHSHQKDKYKQYLM